jgi:RNA polymerase sigma-70 factor (ECF subfamily)
VDTGERALVRQAQEGDTAAFEALVNSHAPLVYNLALRTLNDPHEAEDMAQEAFLRAWQSLPRFQGNSRFSTWLYRIVTNLCYNRLPRLKAELAAVESDAEIELPDEHQAVETKLLTAERRAHLHSAIDALPESYRLLITLRHLQGMAYAEIAEVTNMPLGSVKTGIFRARRTLRDALESYEGLEHERIQ